MSGCGITGRRKTNRQHNATPTPTGPVLVAAVFAAKHVDAVHRHGPLLHELEEPAPSARVGAPNTVKYQTMEATG